MSRVRRQGKIFNPSTRGAFIRCVSVTHTSMKLTLQFLAAGLFMMTLSSCDVGAGAYAGARPGYYGRSYPGYHRNTNYYNDGYHHDRYYDHNRPSYYRPAGVNAGVNARVAPLNVNTNTRLGLF